MNQGSYPLNGRTLTATDTATGVVSGATADIPLGTLQAMYFPSGPTASRPAAPLIGSSYFDTDLGLPIWVKATSPAVVWVNAAGAQV